MTTSPRMTADQYTKLWFYRGKFRYFIAACYLGYREGGYGRLTSALWVIPNVAWVGWDRLWH
jgi:hypothetical protein